MKKLHLFTDYNKGKIIRQSDSYCTLMLHEKGKEPMIRPDMFIEITI